MKEVFDLNYAVGNEAFKELAPCLACKNRLDLPCEGCEHYEDKKTLLAKKALMRGSLEQLNSPTQMKHRIVEAIMAKQHELEEEVDRMVISTDADAFDRSERMTVVEGLKMAVEIARKVE